MLKEYKMNPFYDFKSVKYRKNITNTTSKYFLPNDVDVNLKTNYDIDKDSCKKKKRIKTDYDIVNTENIYKILVEKPKKNKNILEFNKYNDIENSNEYKCDSNDKKPYCVNCGRNGHIFKKCLLPILSYGLIGYYIDNNTNDIFIIMIQSKNTFSFLDFISGKYDIYNCTYNEIYQKLDDLFSKMTINELNTIKTKSFNEIWDDTYFDFDNDNDIVYIEKKKDNNNIYLKNTKLYNNSYDKYNFIINGFTYNDKMINLNYFINKYLNDNNKNFISWSFPKGRRNYKESDLNCAVREFEEETNIEKKYFEIKEHKKIYKENYTGDNNVNYEHRYYLAELYHMYDLEIDPNNIHQKIEIGNLSWININDAKNIINPFYSKRINIIENLKYDILQMHQNKNNYFKNNYSIEYT